MKRTYVAILALLLAPIIASGTALSTSNAWQRHVAPRLVDLWSAAHSSHTLDVIRRAHTKNHYGIRVDSMLRVQMDLFHACGHPVNAALLSNFGFHAGTNVEAGAYCVVEGWGPVAALPKLAVFPHVTHIELPVYAHTSNINLRRYSTKQVPLAIANTTSSIDGAGVTIMQADQYVTQTSTNGSGITVGVISDDVTNLAVIQGRGELPASITVQNLNDPNPNPTDEGTMMLEEVHAVAPGASLQFCGPNTTTEYIKCLQLFAGDGVKIAVDDLGFPADDLMSAQSIFAQGVASVLSANPNFTLFSSTDNQQQAYWQGSYNPSTFTFNSSSSLTCSANGQVDSYLENFGTVLYQTLTLSAPLTGPLYLQWADPYGQNVSNFDLYILDGSYNVLACVPGAGSLDTFDELADSSIAAGTYYLLIGTPDQTSAGKFLKLIAYADGAGNLSMTTPGAVDSPQKFLSGVQTVGAVDGGDGVGNIIEPFSNTGPIQLEFPSPATVQAPIFVAPDDIAIDDVGTDFTQDPFFGTSAAAPNAAAVAALLEASFKGAPVSTLLSAMQTGAAQLGTTVPDGVFGYGRVDAIGALNSLPLPTLSTIQNTSVVGGKSSAPISIAMSGVGDLTLSGASDNQALVDFGASGNVTIDTTGCGTSTDSCTITVTPTLGQTGTANLTIYASDGAGRSASQNFSVSVTKPTAPTSSGGSNQTVDQGHAFASEQVTFTGTEPLAVTLASSNSSLISTSGLTLNSGCGTTTLACSVSISAQSNASGSSTITVTGTDPYGQSAHTSFSLTVTAPTKSGGGGGVSLGLLTLASICLFMRRRQLNR